MNSGVVFLLAWLIWAAVNTAIKFGRGSKQPDNENNRTICLRMNSGAVRLGYEPGSDLDLTSVQRASCVVEANQPPSPAALCIIVIIALLLS